MFMVTTFLFLAVAQAFTLFIIGDAGYGDTYVLYDVLHFQKTGEIYRDLSQPPYLPAQYSPLVYMMYAIPRWNAFGNPYFGPRLMAIAVFSLCVAMAVSIAQTLVCVRYSGLWGFLLATSNGLMFDWVLQLRGDFPAIFCGLTAIRLLMAKPRSTTVVLSGLFAGFATQFKFVYVTSMVAGTVWLLCQKRFREFVLFAAAASLTSIGLYFLLWLREPRMLAQMLALSPGIPDYRGLVWNLHGALETPVVLLALAALPFLMSRVSSRWVLLLLFASISFAIATATGLQAGANINYYFEMLFALVPLATLGTLQLLEWSRDNMGLAIFVAGLALIQFLVGATGNQIGHSSFLHSVGTIRDRNDSFRKLSVVLRDRKILSLPPSLALLDSQPALVEPFLASYERRLGKFNIQPLLSRVRNSEFDVVITSKDNDASSYRGVPSVDPLLRQAILEKYMPYCTILNSTLNLPRDRQADRMLLANLPDMGCKPLLDASKFTDFFAGRPE
jgi:hypothetical protein